MRSMNNVKNYPMISTAEWCQSPRVFSVTLWYYRSNV